MLVVLISSLNKKSKQRPIPLRPIGNLAGLRVKLEEHQASVKYHVRSTTAEKRDGRKIMGEVLADC